MLLKFDIENHVHKEYSAYLLAMSYIISFYIISFTKNIQVNPDKSWYKFYERQNLVPTIIAQPSLPVSFLFSL